MSVCLIGFFCTAPYPLTFLNSNYFSLINKKVKDNVWPLLKLLLSTVFNQMKVSTKVQRQKMKMPPFSPLNSNTGTLIDMIGHGTFFPI